MRRIAIPLQISRAVGRPPLGDVHLLRGQTMGTTWSVRYVSIRNRDTELRVAIERTLSTIIGQMSTWVSNSDVCRFNRSPIGEWFSIKPELSEVIACGLQIQHATDGAFDPALGKAVEAWGFGASGPVEHVPSQPFVAGQTKTSIELDPEQLAVRRTRNVWIELSGIAKGYAVDSVLRTLQSAGVPDCLVEIGGELSGAGVKPDGSPWWIAVDHPSNSQPLIIALHGLSVATSGIERRIDIAGHSWSHTINPTIGYPIDNSIIQCTVLADKCMTADAQTTALIVKGAASALRWANANDVAAIIWEEIDGSLNEWISRPLQMLLSDN